LAKVIWEGRLSFDVAVIGAGVFGAWTAERLRVAGRRVLLVDAWGPGHARASSGGESRLIRTAYGADAVYSRMARESLGDWRALSEAADLPLLHQAGVLFFFDRDDPYARDSQALHAELGYPMRNLAPDELARRYPQVDWAGVRFGLLEPEGGILMARRGVQTLVERFVAGGGAYIQAAVRPPTGPRVETIEGEVVAADRYVFACGPWLPKLFPDLLGGRIFPTRQEVLFFAPPAGDRRFGPDALPGWVDFNGGDMVYGMPDLEGRGFKLAIDRHGPPIDPDSGDRTVSAAGIEEARAYLARRFPALGGAQLVETRVCQYENSSNGDFLIDRHPEWDNVLLVGAGSGHGFKHGPAVGRMAAVLALEPAAAVEPRFGLASKGVTQRRAVH
jgi:glycine/D-amino acid oxidase-like deaminating enzyme